MVKFKYEREIYLNKLHNNKTFLTYIASKSFDNPHVYCIIKMSKKLKKNSSNTSET